MSEPFYAYLGDRPLRREFLRLYGDQLDRGVCIRGTCGAFTGPHGTWQGTAFVCALRALDMLHGLSPRAWAYDATELARSLGIHRHMLELFDWVFESLPDDRAADRWAYRFFEALPLGLDTSVLWPQIYAFLPRAIPAGLVELLRRHVVDTGVYDGEWEPYRSPDGLGIPAAGAVAELVLHTIEGLDQSVTALPTEAQRALSHAQADALIRRIGSA